ncbi:MAG TPA: MATE family efflux transporter [Bacilli bacterium]|nr:MATE family efflux transporter [Bacilli bacterium]
MKHLERNIYKLTWPIFIEMLFFMLMGSVDTLMLSKYSDLSVASVGNANTVLNVFGVLFNVIAAGIAIVVSQYLGANREKEAKVVVKSGVYTNFAVGIVIFFILQLFGKLIFQAIKTDVDIIDWSLSYLKTIAWSLLFVSISSSFSSAFRSYGKPKVVMSVMILANLLNVLLNYIFIFGNFGAPRLGVYGAALGTLISRIFIFVMLLINMMRLLQINMFKFHYDSKSVLTILKVGLPSALENFMYSFSQIFILSFINKMGTDAVTSRSYVMLLLTYVYVFTISFSNANSIIVGYYIGEKKPEEAYKQSFKTLKITLIFITIMLVVMNILADPILRLLTENEAIIQLSKTVLLTGILLEIARVLNWIFLQSLRGTGDTVFPLKVAVVSMYGVSVLFSYILGLKLNLGLVGVFIALSLDEFIRGLAMLLRWKSKKWVTKSLVK